MWPAQKIKNLLTLFFFHSWLIEKTSILRVIYLIN